MTHYQASSRKAAKRASQRHGPALSLRKVSLPELVRLTRYENEHRHGPGVPLDVLLGSPKRGIA